LVDQGREVTTERTSEKAITKCLTIQALPTSRVAKGKGRLSIEKRNCVSEETMIRDGRWFYN
jgi:hypothetical protein